MLRLALLLMLLATPAWATTYYVDASTGNNADDGLSEANAFATINKCITTLNGLSGAHTCLVKNGTYNVTAGAPHTFTTGGTAGNFKELKNFSGHSPVISSADKTISTHFGILLNPGGTTQIGYIRIQGFEITNVYSGISTQNNAHHIEIIGNNCHDNYHGCIGLHMIDSLISGNILRHNGRFAECAVTSGICNQDHPVYLSGSRNVLVNNLIYDNLAYGLHLYSLDMDAGVYSHQDFVDFKDNLIAFNTIAFENNRGAVILWRSGTGSMTNNRIENNIFYENGNSALGAGNPHGIECLGAQTGNVSKNNLFYATTPGSTTRIGGCGANLTETSSQLGHPQFVDAGAGNFRLLDTSPAIGTGRDLTADGLTVDYAGTTRANPPNIGAFESEVPDPPGPVGGQPNEPLETSPRRFRSWH